MIAWGSVAEWVSGIGSLSASIVALYISLEARRIKLRGYCGVREIVQQGAPVVTVLSVGVTNIGTRSTIVNNVGIRSGARKKARTAIIVFNRDAWSDGIPCTIADGKSGRWSIILDAERTWVRELAEGMLEKSGDLVSTLRFSIHTSHGATLWIKPDDSLTMELLKFTSVPAPKKYESEVSQLA